MPVLLAHGAIGGCRMSTRKVFPGEGLDALEEPGAVIRVWRLTEAVAS